MVAAAPITDEEKRELLRIARATLREFTATGRMPPGRPHRESLLQPAAAFVTLHRNDELRGCIGTCEADSPLYRTVQEMAIAAASRDPRFAPLTREELSAVEVEISILGEFRPISGPDDITLGVDGLIVNVNGRRGLLLPQVATEAGWDATEFLAGVCTKAGAPADAWTSSDATLEAFTATVFNDRSHPPAHPPAARPGSQIPSH